MDKGIRLEVRELPVHYENVKTALSSAWDEVKPSVRLCENDCGALWFCGTGVLVKYHVCMRSGFFFFLFELPVNRPIATLAATLPTAALSG